MNKEKMWQKSDSLVGRTLFTKRKRPFKIVGLSQAGMQLTIGVEQRQISYSRELILKFCQHRLNGGQITPESLRSAKVHFARKSAYSYLPVIVDEMLIVYKDEQQVAVDIQEPDGAKRTETKIMRIIRDSDLSRKVKEDNGFKCQICGEALTLRNGKLYAEAHHIKPLGLPHNGPDIRENILCVCPNHHALLDYGSIELSEDLCENGIGKEYIDYHNKRLCRL